jgi:hypothetical protein
VIDNQLVFRPLLIEDKDLIKEYFTSAHSKMCDYSVCATYMWKDYCNTEICVQDGILFLKSKYFNGKTSFSMPIGNDNIKGISKILDYCRQNRLDAVFAPVSKEETALISDNFKIKSIYSERDWFDYIYDASDIVSFSGRKYNGQRNHINHFKRLYPEYKFAELNDETKESAGAFFKSFRPDENEIDSVENEEFNTALYMVENYKLFDLYGGLIIVDDKVVALSLGEIINDTLFIHIERSNKEYKGVSQLLVNEYAKHFAGENVHFINRLEDVGNEGLRTSKLSYHPVYLLEKYTLEVYL